MRTVRKLLGFMLAVGLMVSAMSVFASGSSDYVYVPLPAGGEPPTPLNWDYDAKGWYEGNHYHGAYPPPNAQEGTKWTSWDGVYDCAVWTYTDGQWISYDGEEIYGGGSSSSSSSSDSSDSKSALEKEAEERAAAEAEKERLIQEQASRDAVRLAGAASDEGFADMGDMYIAAQKSMSAGEFYNNAVVSTPGIENAVTVGQGGNLVVNGEVTNMSATITKVTNRAYVDSVRIEQEGRVLNVVDVSYPATEATINFYMPGITGEETIAALQYNAGRWVEIEVAEVRADHVVLNMKGNGVVAFIAK